MKIFLSILLVCKPFFCFINIVMVQITATQSIAIKPITLVNIIENIKKVMNDPPIAIANHIRNRPFIPINSNGRCNPLKTGN